MAVDIKVLSNCLQRLMDLVPYLYGQWLVEDPETWDYRVVAARVPDHSSSYEIAHRTGVIGQAFRTQKPLFVPDTRQHVFYDPFDTSVDWELAIPVWEDKRFVGVLNLEGAGRLELRVDLWQALAAAVEAGTSWQVPFPAPRPDTTGLVKTLRLMIQSSDEDASIELARAITRGASTVLQVGEFPHLARCSYPSACLAAARGGSLAECVHGVGPRWDVPSYGTSRRGNCHLRTPPGVGYGARSL